MKTIYRFWNWYDDLEDTDPALRFLCFLTLSIVCLIIPPAIGFFWKIPFLKDWGQVCGVTVMGFIVWTKSWRRK